VNGKEVKKKFRRDRIEIDDAGKNILAIKHFTDAGYGFCCAGVSLALLRRAACLRNRRREGAT
jgi:hypothetical protein